DRALIGCPGEVDGNRVAPVLRAKPQPVGGDGPQFADLDERFDNRAHAAQRINGFDGSLPREVVLRLDLLAAAWGEAHAEVRQAAEKMASKCSKSASQARPSYTCWLILYAGCTSRTTRVTTPSAPSATTVPSNSGSPRRSRATSPSGRTSSSSLTAVARFPLA